MTIDRATEILKALADGTDPLTGEALPDDNICNKVEIARAFYCILNELALRKAKHLPENAGKPWSKEDDEALEKLYADGISQKAMADQFKRTKWAITSRLKFLGLIDEQGKNEGNTKLIADTADWSVSDGRA